MDIKDDNFWAERLAFADETEQIRRSVYDANATVWDKIERAHKRICAEHITPVDYVLDAGCGYGRMSTWFPKYVGVDISPTLLERAREMYPWKKFIEADLRKIPMDNSSADWAVCVSIRHMVEQREGKRFWKAVEKELKRVAYRVLILEYTECDKYEIL